MQIEADIYFEVDISNLKQNKYKCEEENIEILLLELKDVYKKELKRKDAIDNKLSIFMVIWVFVITTVTSSIEPIEFLKENMMSYTLMVVMGVIFVYLLHLFMKAFKSNAYANIKMANFSYEILTKDKYYINKLFFDDYKYIIEINRGVNNKRIELIDKFILSMILFIVIYIIYLYI